LNLSKYFGVIFHTVTSTEPKNERNVSGVWCQCRWLLANSWVFNRR